MRRQTMHRGGDFACNQVGQATERAGSLLASLCLFIGAAIAAFFPAALEKQILNFLFFGLIPALGFYVSGCVLRHVLLLSCKLCGIIASRCFRRTVIFASTLAKWSGRIVPHLLDTGSITIARFLFKLRLLAQKSAWSGQNAYCLVCRCHWQLNKVILELCCLLIRSTARFLIRLQTVPINRQTGGERRPLLFRRLLGRGSGPWPVNRAVIVLAVALGLGWFGGGGLNVYWLLEKKHDVSTDGGVNAVVARILSAESNGNPNEKNERSSATGLGQFLNETWLEMIRAYRPDLRHRHTDNEILELRREPKLAREITMRFAERNAAMLRRRGLPVTPGTVYLAHFAGGAGAVAILSAPEDADAALILAGADATGRTKRDKITKANPFLERFTVADLKNWADRKMRGPGLRSTQVLAADVRQ